jgi:hypothetical protein
MKENTVFQAVWKDPPASKQGMEEDPEAFYDTKTYTKDEYPATSYYSNSFGCARNESAKQKMIFFDPGDITEKGKFGKAFHLTLNYDAFLSKSEEKHIFVRESTVDEMLDQFTQEELSGRNESFDSYVYAIRCIVSRKKIWSLYSPILDTVLSK